MENKGWLGSELVFDIDATDMHLKCQTAHGTSWVCENCLAVVRGEAIKLIEEFLIPDFGFSKQEISVNFSGNRGYHIHVNKESILKLDSAARKEISAYITGSGISFEDFFTVEGIGHGKRIKRLAGPKPTEPGWRGRIARSVISDMNKGIEHLISTGIDPAAAKNMFKKRALIEMGINNGNWDMVYVRDKTRFWSDVIKSHAIAQSDRIDENVTNDTGHMIRLANTIHGSTGLLSKKADTGALQSFEPMTECVVLAKDQIKVKANTKNPLDIGGETFGPYSGEEAELPGYAAMYLFLKGFAEIMQE
jgi:DNA primase small subunit